MARVYRDGLDAIRRQFLAKRQKLRRRDDALRDEAGDVLTKDALDNLDRARGRVDVSLDDLDELVEGDDQLVAYERLIQATERRVDDLRDQRRRLRPFLRAAKVLAVLLVVVGGMGFVGWRHQEQLRAESLAAKAASCRSGPRCFEDGLCDATRDDGVLRCAASTDAQCAVSRACRDAGRCRAADGTCRAIEDAECAESRGCALLGRCAVSAYHGGCAATANAHCQPTPLCEAHDLCVATAGRCVTTRGGVRDIAQACDDLRCAVRGACTSRDGRCVAGDNRDCLLSQDCEQQGLCLARDGRCVADDAGCLRSAACEHLGQCHARGERCVDVTQQTASGKR